jgi:type I restriction enzyme M protein
MVNNLLQIDESYKAPQRLLGLMLDDHQRTITFENFLKVSKDLSFDWFYQYFTDEQAERRTKKQDFTPKSVTKLMNLLIKENCGTYFEAAAGTGGMLISNWTIKPAKYYFVEEKSDRAIPFLLFNMAIRNIKGTVIQCDSLTQEIKITYELKPGKKFSFISMSLNLGSDDLKFSQVLMNPPYSLKWSADKKLLKDPRFSKFGVLPPKSKADYAFLLHGLYHLKNSGTMAIVLPHGVLFRSGSEGKIRKKLLENGSIDAVIGLPANLFNSTSISTCILVLKKDKQDRDVMFIDASKEFEKKKNQNKLRGEDIQKILDTYEKRKDVERYAHLAKFDEIEANDFNLNIPRYVDTYVPEPPIDLGAVVKDLNETDKALRKNSHELAKMIGELTSDDPKMMADINILREYLNNEYD